MMTRRCLLLPCALLLLVACASPSHTVDPHPAERAGEASPQAYEAKAGSISPATESDGAIAAGLATLSSAFGHGGKRGGGGSRSSVGARQLLGRCEFAHAEAAGPCAHLALRLVRAGDGVVVAQKRTDAEGGFSFDGLKEGDSYVLEPESSRFLVVTPASQILKPGTYVELALRAKSR